VSPKDSTTYTLEVTGPSGSANCSARVTVTPAPSPPVAAKGTVKEETVEDDRTTLKDAFFDYDSAVLRPDAQQAFTEDANFLKAHPTINFTVEGHCDQRGSEEYNLALGDRRARAGSEFLIRLGIDSARVKAISYGKGRPRCTQGSEECWEINRRDHITLNRPESNP
jgi:peptidoglycan-associated lipoprotein